MATVPHDKSGTSCGCGYVFTKTSFAGTIKIRNESGNIEAVKKCRKCLNEHYAGGKE